jgi:hypothetical protein
MEITDTIRAAALAAAVHALTTALLRRYGPTMDSDALAGLLGIRPSGLRMRRQRGASLPPHLGDAHAVAWSTASVALWLVGVESPSSAAGGTSDLATEKTATQGERTS